MFNSLRENCDCTIDNLYCFWWKWKLDIYRMLPHASFSFILIVWEYKLHAYMHLMMYLYYVNIGSFILHLY